MKKTALTLALVILALGVLIALPTADTARASTIDHYFTLTDDGKVVTVNLGEIIQLDLGHDYTWTVSLSNPQGRPPVLQMLSWSNGTTGTNQPSSGLFQAIGRGQATIRAYGVPICSGLCLPYIRRFELTVVVQ